MVSLCIEHRGLRLGLTVSKMRANPVDRVTHECEILDGKGMRVLPRALPVAKQPWRSPVYRSVSSLSVASDFPQARFWIVSALPTARTPATT